MSLRHDDDDIFEYTPKFDDFDKAQKLDNNKVVSDSDIACLAQGDGFPMTAFQTKFFVVGDGLTPYRMTRQALVEIDTRRASLHSMIKNQKKAKAELALIERDIDNESDVLRRDLIKCEYEDKLYDITVWDHKIPQASRELKEMINHLRSLFPNNPTIEDIKNIAKEDPEQERFYWQVRMAKQTATDMISYGRIGAGQMASIMMMDPADQEVVITKAIEFSTKLNNTLGILGEQARNSLLGLNTEEMQGMPVLEDSVEEAMKHRALVQSESIDD
jgi:hypothetical protein